MNRQEQATIEMMMWEIETLRVINDSMARKLYRIVDECGIMLLANPTDEKVARIRSIALEQTAGNEEVLKEAVSTQANVGLAWMEVATRAEDKVAALEKQLREQKRTTATWIGHWLEDNEEIVLKVLEDNPELGRMLRKAMGVDP